VAAQFWSPSYIQHSAHIEPGTVPADLAALKRWYETVSSRRNAAA